MRAAPVLLLGLLYAWNEFDEGGFVCPTLAKYEGAARLDAIGAMLTLY